MISDFGSTSFSNAGDTQEWVEVRVNDDATGTHSTYVGLISIELLQACTRIEHGELWFQLVSVMWHHDEETSTEITNEVGFWRTLFNEVSDTKITGTTDRIQSSQRGLQRQSVKASYWGYSDRVYLRLDRVYRIVPLSDDYIANVIQPVLMQKSL